MKFPQLEQYLSYYSDSKNIVAVVCESEYITKIDELSKKNNTSLLIFTFDQINDIPKINISAIIIVPKNLSTGLRIHEELQDWKNREIPVLFGDKRDVFMGTPSWGLGGSGLTYAGMFKLVSSYLAGRQDIPENAVYAEFGVFDGRTFTLAYHCFKGFCSQFLAYDSFCGIQGADLNEESTFKDGDYFSNIETFKTNLRVSNVDLNRVSIVKKNFLELEVDLDESQNIVIVHIDCDVSKAAFAALSYVENRLGKGGIILFDDYDEMFADNTRGERAAFKKWQELNKHIEITEYRTYAATGRCFLFYRKEN